MIAFGVVCLSGGVVVGFMIGWWLLPWLAARR